ncbi:MAG: hypothetical protein EHM17_14120 [Verrucomicrobiaceae bacterium]|nr:MAG: hypothetical protein EHM17_14120 [Verrucomicrobiaceae bacterium]
MDHPASQPLFPSLAPDSKLLQRIAALRRWLDRLLSFSCKTVLVIIPVLFAVAHIGADGEPWDFATGEKFNPLFHVISSYAWRSPAGWAMVACMAGLAFGLGFVSWHAMKRGPGFFSWLTAVSAAVAMLLLLQAAWLPIKPDRETFHKIQQEAAWGPTKERKQEMWSGGLYAVGVPRPEWVRSPEYLASLRSHWIHQHAIGSAQVLIIITIMGASFLWSSRTPDGKFWRSFMFWAEWVVLILVGGGLLGRLWLPEFNGLTQRLSYLGFYLWLLVIVREIERCKIPEPETNGGGEANELDECGRDDHADVENLPAVTDTPLHS